MLDWRRVQRQGSLPSVGEISGSHWTATARPSWAAPSQLGVVPPQSAFLIGCMGIRIQLTSRLLISHQAKNKAINTGIQS